MLTPEDIAAENAEMIAEADRRTQMLDACYGALIDHRRGFIRREYGWPETLDLLTQYERAPRRATER